MSAIVLLSDDKKKSLLGRFCDAYKSVLAKYSLFSTYLLSYFISETLDGSIKVRPLLDDGVSGYQQVISKIYCNEIILVIFFKDISSNRARPFFENELFRACDLYNIPYATNLAMAEIFLNTLLLGK